MNRRGWVVVALWTLFAVSAAHSKASALPDKPMSCTSVRLLVATVGKDEAERLARAHGWTDDQIAQARKCLR